jgi:hypothetical protein
MFSHYGLYPNVPLLHGYSYTFFLYNSSAWFVFLFEYIYAVKCICKICHNNFAQSFVQYAELSWRIVLYFWSI